MTALVAGVLGLVVGFLVNRAAGRFPWHARGAGPSGGERPRAVRLPVVEVGTAALFVLTAILFGPSAELPAFLYLAGAGVLLAVIDLQHRLLPDRVVLPSVAIGVVLLAVAALPHGHWPALLRGVSAGVVLFVVFFVMALISPGSLGVGDAKLAALLGLYLGWLGWNAVLLGAVAGFVVQALLALVLLATRRVGLRSELPFGPAMLAGAAVVIGFSEALGSSATLLG
ncbi:MAG: prepilin peptidase [Blastococcus sp.]